uniref:Ricin B-type lectin domain-containing protein n=1 Tax=Haemonchus placei TaxID=6290 RepID=A0A158QN41_HAEPC
LARLELVGDSEMHSRCRLTMECRKEKTAWDYDRMTGGLDRHCPGMDTEAARPDRRLKHPVSLLYHQVACNQDIQAKQ